MNGEEIAFHSFGFGLNRDGKPSVSFTVTLPNGLEGSIGWEEDADDTLQRERIIAYYEPKIIEKMSGAQGFTPTIQGLGFEAEKP